MWSPLHTSMRFLYSVFVLAFPLYLQYTEYRFLHKEAYHMTQKSRKQLDYAVSTQAIEKLFPSEKALLLCEQVSNGAISTDDAVATVLKQYGLKQVPAHG